MRHDEQTIEVADGHVRLDFALPEPGRPVLTLPPLQKPQRSAVKI